MSLKVQIIITTALQCESLPIISYFDLKLQKNDLLLPSFKFKVYRGKIADSELHLIQSGVGPIKAALALARYVDFVRITSFKSLNIGVAGIVCSSDQELGDAFLINRIIDLSSGKNYIPDILYKHNFKEACLLTSARPVNSIYVQWSDSETRLVDMEAAAIASVAMDFVGPESVSFIKIASDFVQPLNNNNNSIEEKINIYPGFVSELINFNLTKIEKHLVTLNEFPNNQPLLSLEFREKLLDLTSKLKFSISQYYQLIKFAKLLAIRSPAKLNDLQEFIENLRCNNSRDNLRQIKAFVDSYFSV